MKIYVTSDTHDNDFNPPDDVDAVIHCGDFTNYGMRSSKTFHTLALMERIAHKYPFYWVPGNHDFGFDNLSPLYGHNTHRQLTVLNNHLILGMSYSPCYNMPELYDTWCNMVKDVDKETAYYESLPYADIIISHCPPKNIGLLDTCAYSGVGNLGSQGLYEYIIKYQPNFVFCGHIHQKEVLEAKIGQTKIYNVARQNLILEI